ncbi:MAG: PopZ family protein [Shinella sp.]|uniref:PopZ family protein n=1 Tax=Shinella sp. TaxID=1870904 RepID=UPI004035D6EC
MAQPNVAREPSMDEILASIRKIIENNEALTDFAADAQDDEGFDITTESHSNLLDHPSVVERFHAEEHRSAGVQPIQRTEPLSSSQPALSLADVAARVRAASERHIAANREPMEREPVLVDPQEVAAERESPLAVVPMTPAANRFLPMAELVEKIEPVVETFEAARPFVEPVRQEEVRVAEPTAVVRDIATLVSPAVGERVAQSFGALAEAIDAGPRRSFDEIAEEMLRPMLQDWLEDNLPTLVERLVREEIERVARGPRR